jgi:hypothetical protein
MKSIDDFKSQISARGGLAKPSLFRVIIPNARKLKTGEIDASESFMFLCESTSLPGRNIDTVDVVYQNNSIKVPHSFSVEDVSMSFIVTNDFFIKKVLDDWHNLLIDRGNYRVSFKESYTRDISIQELDMTGKVVYAIILRNAYPNSISPIEVASDNESVMKLTASFTYEDYEELDATKISGELSTVIPDLLRR